jgi:hypothetical protein
LQNLKAALVSRDLEEEVKRLRTAVAELKSQRGTTKPGALN